MPGMEVYAEILLAIDTSPTWHSLSLYPHVTEITWLAVLPMLALFLVPQLLHREQLSFLVYVLIGVAIFQAVLGLIQYGDGTQSLFRFGMEGHNHSAIGTYPNRNHLAGYLEMLLPIMIAISLARFTKSETNSRFSLRKKLAGWGRVRHQKTIFLGLAIVLVVLGLIFTRSRTGIALTMIGIFLCAILYSRLFNKNFTHKSIFVLVVAVLVIAAEAGLTPILNRFTLQDPLADSRWTIYSDTLQGIQTFFPFGSGPGTFSYVFPRFQSPELSKYINYAHNDYLELLFEGGIFAGLLIVFGIVLFCMRWLRVLALRAPTEFNFIQIGSGIAIILMLLHSFLDFNLHIPANAIVFSFLCGIFFKKNTYKK